MRNRSPSGQWGLLQDVVACSSLTLKKYRTLESVVMFYDSNDLRWNAHAPRRTGLASPPRHSGGDNIGYADGHVKFLRLIHEDD